MSFHKGLKPSTPSKIAHRLGAHRLGLVGTPKGASDLTPFLAPRMDQGASSTCHAHSLASAIYAAFSAKGKSLPFVPSPLLIASTTYADIRAAAYPTGGLPPLVDTGAELQDDATAVKQWGIAPIRPLVDRYSDVPNGANPFPEPDVTALQIAGADLVGGEYSISVNSDAPEVCALALDEGIPIWLGTLVGKDFEDLGPNGIAQPTPSNDRTAGGHAVFLSSYRTSSSGSFEYLIQNSWSDSWGNNGSVWASTAWLLACWELWPCAVII